MSEQTNNMGLKAKAQELGVDEDSLKEFVARQQKKERQILPVVSFNDMFLAKYINFIFPPVFLFTFIFGGFFGNWGWLSIIIWVVFGSLQLFEYKKYSTIRKLYKI